MLLRIWAALLFVTLASAAAAQTQQPVDRNCRDDRGRERCADSALQQLRTLYGVQSIEELAASGAEVRRIFYVDGYGRDTVLIAFVRAPTSDPTLWIHHPRQDGEERLEPFHAPVPIDVWNEVIERGRNFHRSFAGQSGPTIEPDGSIMVCSHSWIYVVEAAERASAGRPGRIRRKIEDACQDGPAKIYAGELERIALALIPHCAALEPEQYRNPASILAACRMLHGDRLAAAEVMNRAMAFRELRGPVDVDRISGSFAEATEIDWAGQLYRGSGYRAGEFWTARLERGDGRPTHMYFERAVGETADRVRVAGMLSRSIEDGTETAAIEQIWARDINGLMQLERATIGPWQRRR
jgi:hypothetical protein